jgi:glycosyltransferase involved in cell wall biosynthesis
MRDPWTSNPYKIYPTRLHRHLDKQREKRTIAKIDFIISAYQSIVDEYREFSRARFCILPNGYDEEDFLKLDAAEVPDKSGFNIAFSGTFYSHLNRPDSIFAAMYKLKLQNIHINFHHVGFSVYNVLHLARRYKVDDQVWIWGYKNHHDCLQILSGMDALCLILDHKYPNAEKTIGGKVYEYLRLKKPIMAVVPESGEAARLIERCDAGLICPENTPDNVAAVLQKLAAQQISFSFRNIEQFERAALAQNLNVFLEEINA